MIYDPSIKPSVFKSSEEYKSSKTHTINHFYEKLLKLKDSMNTDTGRKIASARHDYLESYLKQFYKEWNSSY